ncbi:MAG: hypothetical protein A2285_03950 [Elusimicrobia bacterium RIFOXYA12_FULL_57_11]|nr:MAG: hypothetical protein A2285_03950 [Elusimicrobia bacterium RIFOXYA12_FULL_57_11]
MLKKIFICLAAVLVLSLQVSAQQAVRRELVVIHDFDDVLRFNMAVWHAIQLKQAGVDVRVVFEGDAVLNFLPRQDGDMRQKSLSLERVNMEKNKSRLKNLVTPKKGRDLLKELADLKVPYTVCSFFATLFNKYAELKAAGVPMSADPENRMDLSPFIRDNYQLLIF